MDSFLVSHHKFSRTYLSIFWQVTCFEVSSPRYETMASFLEKFSESQVDCYGLDAG